MLVSEEHWLNVNSLYKNGIKEKNKLKSEMNSWSRKSLENPSIDIRNRQLPSLRTETTRRL